MPSSLTTAAFFDAVLPSSGVYFAVRPNSKFQGRTFLHDAYTDTHNLALAVLAIARNNQDAYFACASYANAGYTDTLGKFRTRTQENVLLLKSVWTDIDVGKPGCYATRPDAISAIKTFCLQDAGIPLPTVWVISGNGVHVYWTFDTDLTPTAWQPIADRLQALQAHYGLLADHGVTTDSARVLRPVNTYNFKKADNPLAVTGRLLGDHLSPDDFLAALEARCDLLSLELHPKLPRRARVLEGDLSDLTGGVSDYPPADAEKIADQCLVMAEMRATQGANQDNPVWFACLTILNKCTQRDELAHTWSSGHEDYDPQATDAQLDRLDSDGYKPTGCTRMRTLTPICQSCTLKIEYPVLLGSPGPVQQTQVQDPEGEGETESVPQPSDVIMENFKWNTQRGLQVRVPGKGKDDEPGEDLWVTCSWQYPVPEFLWFDGTEYIVRLRARIRYDDWVEADIPLGLVGQGGAPFLRELAGKLRVLSVGPASHMERFVKTWIDEVQQRTDMRQVRNSMGWQEDGGFLLGTRLYQPDGTIGKTAIGKNILKYVGAHEPRGTLEEYSRTINSLYNRPRFQPYQFALLASLGSALLSLVWNGAVGIPLVLWSGKTGLGKSTVARAGLAMWGNPEGFGQTASAQGLTELALYTMAGQRKHMPVLLDETTPWEGDRLSDFAYRYADGTPKQQAKAEGGLRDNSHLSWANVIYLTSNNSVINQITASKKNAAAQVARIFEIEIPDLGLVTDDQHLLDVLYQNTGVAGQRFIAAIATTAVREKVTLLIKAKIKDLYARTSVATEGRYWVHLAACTLVAGEIAARLGIHQFNMKLLDHWARDRINEMSGSAILAYEEAEDTVSDLLRDVYPGLIITLNEGHGTKGAVLAPNTYPPRNAVKGRMVIESNLLYLATGAINEWCTKHGVDARSLASALHRKGILLERDVRYPVGRGTNIPVARARCWLLTGDLTKAVVDDETAKIEQANNILRGDFRGHKSADQQLDPDLPIGETRADAG